MPLRQFEWFLKVVECKSINRAAQSLFISQQSLRASVDSLEQKMGFPLLVRNRSGVFLTPQGEAVIDDIRQIVALSHRWRKIAELPDSIDVTVHVVASTGVYNSVLTGVVLECGHLYPNMTLKAFEARENNLLSYLGRRNMIGILGSAPTTIADGRFRLYAQEHGFALELLCPDTFEVMFHSSHPLAKKEVLDLDDLSVFTLATYPNEERTFYYKDLYPHFKPVSPIYMSKQESILQILVQQPGTAAVFPRIIKQGNPYFQHDDIVSRPVRDYPMPGISCLFYPSEGCSVAERIVLDLIRTAFQKLKL